MDTGNLTEPKLKQDKMVPLFSLPSTAGGTVGPGASRSRHNLVVAFLGRGSEAEQYLRALSSIHPELQAEQARVLAVVTLDMEEASGLRGLMDLPFPLLSDASGATTGRMLGDAALCALCVADRFGEVVSLETAASPAHLPAPQWALDWLIYVQSLCPE